MAAMGSSFNEDTGSFGYTPTAEITVAVSIACLFVMGLICSFPTLWLHKVFIWFAPINSKYSPIQQASLLLDANNSLGICSNVHCTLGPDAK
jgi:MFS-type transporter involved in bile tolerance (Atg22 family)